MIVSFKLACTLSDILFQFYVMNFVDFVLITIHISPHMYLKFFARFTHYTSYSLLNIVHVIVCVFRSNQPSLQLLWVFMQNIFCVWEFKRRMFENLNFGKLGLKLVFWKSISSHTHAFYYLYSMIWGIFSKTRLFFSKILFFQNFNWSNLFFDQSKLHLKFYVSVCLFRLIETRLWFQHPS